MSLAEGLGELLLAQHLSLKQLVETVRNQHHLDHSPNKCLDPVMIDYLYKDYIHHDLMVDMAAKGFDPIFAFENPVQRDCPDNHKSARVNIDALSKFLRAGQDDGTMLVLPAKFIHNWRENSNIFFIIKKKAY